MTEPTGCDCGDCCEEARPVFLEGGDDLAVELRELAFGLLLRDRAPVPAEAIAGLAASDEERISATLEELDRQGRIDRDPEGRVVGSAGITLADGQHGLEIDGHAFRTWCAYDAIGIPAALAADARVESACTVCGRAIRLDVRAGRPIGEASARLWLSAGGADMRADFCTPTVLLCSEEHARVWADRQAGRGKSLTLAEAAEDGARSWASAAATAARLVGGTA